MIKEALEYIAELKEEAMSPQVVEINGKTYCNKALKHYSDEDFAEAIQASTLTAMVDYIASCGGEMRGNMFLHVISPTKVSLYSGLTNERKREELFRVVADVPKFRFDTWYDQERFVIELQAGFEVTSDLLTVQKVAGNVEAKSTTSYGDNGTEQRTVIKQGIASKADVLVPNPVTLVPYRTFLEVEQPESQFVFRISEGNNGPQFKLIEAEGGLWRNKAMIAIKEYFKNQLFDVPEHDFITIIA